MDGAPGFFILALRAFDDDEAFTLRGRVPPGLSGIDLGFQGFSAGGSDTVVRTVSFL